MPPYSCATSRRRPLDRWAPSPAAHKNRLPTATITETPLYRSEKSSRGRRIESQGHGTVGCKHSWMIFKEVAPPKVAGLVSGQRKRLDPAPVTLLEPANTLELNTCCAAHHKHTRKMQRLGPSTQPMLEVAATVSTMYSHEDSKLVFSCSSASQAREQIPSELRCRIDSGARSANVEPAYLSTCCDGWIPAYPSFYQLTGSAGVPHEVLQQWKGRWNYESRCQCAYAVVNI